MKHARYMGDVAHLKGKEALIRESKKPGWVFAQFDSIYLDEAFGWREFPADDFQILHNLGEGLNEDQPF